MQTKCALALMERVLRVLLVPTTTPPNVLPAMMVFTEPTTCATKRYALAQMATDLKASIVLDMVKQNVNRVKMVGIWRENNVRKISVNAVTVLELKKQRVQFMVRLNALVVLVNIF